MAYLNETGLATFYAGIKAKLGALSAAFTGASDGYMSSATQDGASGMVPQPLAADCTHVLAGNGNWERLFLSAGTTASNGKFVELHVGTRDVSALTLGTDSTATLAATSTANGLMIAADKAKLDEFSSADSYIKTVNGYTPDANGEVTLPNIEGSTAGRQAFSYTVDPADWLTGIDGEYWTDYVDASLLNIASLALTNRVVVSDVLNEDTGLNPQNGYAFGVECTKANNDLSDPLPNRVRFYYGKGADHAPSNPMTFTGYIKEDVEGTNIGYYINGADSGHPVGSFYYSAYNVSPALLFGGTWERVQGKFLLGATDGGSVGTNLQKTASVEAGSSGGEAAHTLLSPSEIPSHVHGLGYRNLSDQSGSTNRRHGPYGQSSDNTGNVNSAATGSGGSHNNMPPFLSVYIWQRVA